MQYDTIRAERIGAVLSITLDRPGSMNSLNAAMRRELTNAIGGAEADGIRAILLTGAGDAFCSGQDLADGKRLSEIDPERILAEEYAPLIRLIAEGPVPVVAAVNGAAAGAGAALALAADVVVAGTSAVFIEAFSRIGLIPDAGSTWVLPRLVGRARAMGMALFGERVDAVTALDWGLIWEVVPDAGLMPRAMTLAQHLAEGPGKAHAALKQAMAASATNSLEAQMALEARLQGDLGRSRDFREGVMAFLEKRPADFEGR